MNIASVFSPSRGLSAGKAVTLPWNQWVHPFSWSVLEIEGHSCLLIVCPFLSAFSSCSFLMTSVLCVLGLKFKFYSWCPPFQKISLGFWLKFKKWTLGLFLDFRIILVDNLKFLDFCNTFIYLALLLSMSITFLYWAWVYKKRKELAFWDDWALLTSLRSSGTLCLAALRMHDSYSSFNIIMC